MTPDRAGRCARYIADGCRTPAIGSVRVGDHVYRYCAVHEFIVRRQGAS